MKDLTVDFLRIRDDVLKNFDVAIKVDRSKHGYLIPYITSLTIYIGCKFNGNFGLNQSYVALRFIDRETIPEMVELYRALFKNEFPETFSEEIKNGCHIFTL